MLLVTFIIDYILLPLEIVLPPTCRLRMVVQWFGRSRYICMWQWYCARVGSVLNILRTLMLEGGGFGAIEA